MEVGTILGDKAYIVQYIADAPRYTDYLPTVQKMIGSLVIKKSLGTDIGSMPDNGTNLHPDNLDFFNSYEVCFRNSVSFLIPLKCQNS